MSFLDNTKQFMRANGLILGFALFKLLLHLFTNGNYELHRDAYLYLAQGQYPGWGYLEVPPSIAMVAWFIRQLGAESAFTVRLVPSLLGSFMVYVTGLIVKELKGGKTAQFLACMAMLVSPSILRISWLLQPVVFNVFYWTLFAWLILRYINSEKIRYIYCLGIAVGFGLLNKYSVAFYLMALLPILLFTRWRVLFRNSHFYYSLLIAFLIFLPNLVWQWQHNWPVAHHMKELRETQLVHVNALNFLVQQLIINLPALFVWLCGLLWLGWHSGGKRYRLFFFHYLGVLILLLALRGKFYYTLGLYPLLMAAGGVALECWSRKWMHSVWVGLMLIISLPAFPVSLPILKGEPMKNYFRFLTEEVGLTGPVRWEDGKLYDIPQDFADMTGWEELSEKVREAWLNLSEEEQQNCMIYAGNYGYAGAISWYVRDKNFPEVVNFYSSFLLWAPDSFTGKVLIYVDTSADHLEPYFKQMEKTGEIEEPLAREKGTGIFVFRDPKPGFFTLYKEQLTLRKALFRRKK